MEVSSHQLNITRTVNAPLEKVWRAWTDEAELAKWWGPLGVTNPTCQWQAKDGGKIYIVMRAGEELGEMAGQEWPMSGRFLEVTPKEKLVFTSSALRDGKPILENLVTVTFDAHGGQTVISTHVIVTKTTPESEGPLKGMAAGWSQQTDKLVEILEA